jgi:hypothetical protein
MWRGKMKARLVAVVLATLVSGVPAQAGIFSHKTKLPQAQSPVIDRPIREDHKAGYKKHSGKYNDPMWGANFKRWLYPDQNYTTPHWAEY